MICFPGVVQGVEGVKKLFLGAFLLFEEVDVVHQKQVDVAKAAAEVSSGPRLDRTHQLVHKALGGHVRDRGLGPALDGRVPNRVHEMGLAEAYASVNEQWVVNATRPLGHSVTGRSGKLAVVADHEAGEGVALV